MYTSKLLLRTRCLFCFCFHGNEKGQIKRRDEVFLLICDVLGFDEEDRHRLGLPRRPADKGKVTFITEATARSSTLPKLFYSPFFPHSIACTFYWVSLSVLVFLSRFPLATGKRPVRAVRRILKRRGILASYRLSPIALLATLSCTEVVAVLRREAHGKYCQPPRS